MKGLIYKYTFPDGKVYIGQTIRPIEARHREHITPSTGKVNVGFWEAWEKYQEADLEVIETVEEGNSAELTAKLNSLEIKYIAQYRSTDPHFGYNRTSGGFAASATTKVLMKAFKRQLYASWRERELFYNGLIEQIKQAIYTPIPLDHEQALFVREVAIPNVKKEFRGYVRLSSDGILSFPEAKNEHDEFYIDEAISWLLFVVDDIKGIEFSELSRSVGNYILVNSVDLLSEGIIQKVDKDGNVVKEYASITEIMHDLNLSYNTNIYNVLEGKQKTAYGFIWRWKNK